MSQATTMDPRRRVVGYLAQTGAMRMTPKQHRRFQTKQNRWIYVTWKTS